MHAVAQERAEQRGLRALTEVGQAATCNLDPVQLLHDAVPIFGTATQARRCSVGMVDARMVVFAAEHWHGDTHAVNGTIAVPQASLPGAIGRNGGVYVGPLDRVFNLAGLAATAVL